MDVRLTSEQQQLREAAAKLADDLGPGSVADLDDERRIGRLENAVAETGFRTLRSDGASGVEVAVVAEEFARGLVDVPFLGPVLADDLQRTLGREPSAPAAEPASVDLTRSVAGVIESPPELAEIHAEDAGRWHALALAVTMCRPRWRRARHTRSGGRLCEGARTVRRDDRVVSSRRAPARRSLALIEGSISVLRHAAWAVDELPVAQAVEAGRVAKIYCARAGTDRV